MAQKLALVSDFDGTISDNDFFYYITKRYFDEKALAPWRQYLSGKKKHFDALNEMFQSLRVQESELKNFIKTIKLDKTFFPLAAYCQKNNIPVYICSAGCDYYINVLIKKELKKYNLTLVTNRGEYSAKTGLTMFPNPLYKDENLGVSKVSLVKELKKNGYKVIYCGDGLPDILPAQSADKIFARKTLFEECQKKHIKAEFLNTFDNVLQYITEQQS